jgi:hypothetical protein
MGSTRIRAGSAVAAIAATAALLLPAVGASAAPLPPPPTAPFATMTITPTSGNSDLDFKFNAPTPLYCQGSGPVDGYQLNTFMAPLAANPANFAWSAGVPSAGTNPAGFYERMYQASDGSPVSFLAVDSVANPGNGEYLASWPNPFMDFSWAGPGFIPPGSYQIGLACVSQAHTTRYWVSAVTITSNPTTGGTSQLNYSYGTVPAAPVITSIVPGDGTLQVNWTHAASTPPTTGYTLTATPTGGSAIPAVPAPGAGATTFTFTGLANGTAYAISLTATNTTGTSAAATGTSTPVIAPQPPVASISAVPGSGFVDVNWTAPSGATQPITGYALTSNNGAAPASITVANNVFTYHFTSVSTSSPTTFTVMPTFDNGYTAPAASVDATALQAEVITQTITVTRPAGALILTQRCGVYGALDLENATTTFPGYPLSLPAVGASVDTVGTSPDISGTAGQQNDPQFGNYPFPAPVTYPTNCGLSLGTASLVTSGNLAGQYYAASGRLNQVTVVDTRDLDNGWSIAGRMGPFVGSNPANTFSGNYLGWTPKVTSDSAATGGYDQVVTAGTAVAPGTGIPTGSGMAAAGGKTLASAAAGNGVGIAVLDARIKLLIPVSANADTYTGILTLSSI